MDEPNPHPLDPPGTGPDGAANAGDPAELLAEVEQLFGRFVAYPSEHDRVAHVLWVAHTHAMDAWDSTPRIAFLSPEPGSGKSRALEVTELLVPRPIQAVNVTPAYLFRKVGSQEGRPTILYDEIDTVFGPKAKDNEEIRALLNAGHRRHSVAGRCVAKGTQIETEDLPAYCAVALAGLGDLPDTILTRSVVIRMRRRAPGEHIEPYRRRLHKSDGGALRDRLAAWGARIEPTIGDELPDLPEGVVDRHADVWESLIAIADAAGGDWPSRARVAAEMHVAASRESTPSLGVRLLADLRTVFDGREKMATDDIITGLTDLDESPWADLRGKPLNPTGLANRLRKYGVKPKVLRMGTDTVRGYSAEDLHDPWERYCPALSLPSPKGVTPVTTSADQGGNVTPVTSKGVSVTSAKARHSEVVTPVTPVTRSAERGDKSKSAAYSEVEL